MVNDMGTAILIANFFLVAVVCWQTYETRRQATGSESQVAAIRKQTVADHERRKKQSTIEFYTNLRSSRMALQVEIDAALGHDVLRKGDVARLLDDEERGDAQALEIVRLLRHYFTGLESLATGVNMGVYSYSATRRLAGSHVSEMFDQYKAFVLLSRQRKGKDTLYIELERLVERLNREGARDDRGKITHS